MNDFRPAKRRVEVSVGESVRIMRELQELSQNQLAELTGIPQTTISAIENDRVRLGVERAKVLARALKCHPAVLVFPGWDAKKQSAASVWVEFKKYFLYFSALAGLPSVKINGRGLLLILVALICASGSTAELPGPQPL